MKIEPIGEGRHSAMAVVAHTKSERVFLKGTLVEDMKAAEQLQREAAINPYVRDIAPELVCEAEAAGWQLAGFEYVEGRRADYSPDSPDLPKVLETLTALDRLSCPADAPALWFEARWSSYLTRPREQLHHLAGTALLHTDLNPTNMRIGSHKATLVDWTTPSLGARFVNLADLVVCLIACGHTPRDAEAVVDPLPAWRSADPESIDVYARIIATVWLELYWNYTRAWPRAALNAAHRWAMYRRDRT